jgi:hypothetical protein
MLWDSAAGPAGKARASGAAHGDVAGDHSVPTRKQFVVAASLAELARSDRPSGDETSRQPATTLCSDGVHP